MVYNFNIRCERSDLKGGKSMKNKFEEMYGFLIDDYNKAETAEERHKIMNKFAITVLLSERIYECYKDKEKSNK